VNAAPLGGMPPTDGTFLMSLARHRDGNVAEQEIVFRSSAPGLIPWMISNNASRLASASRSRMGNQGSSKYLRLACLVALHPRVPRFPDTARSIAWASATLHRRFAGHGKCRGEYDCEVVEDDRRLPFASATQRGIPASGWLWMQPLSPVLPPCAGTPHTRLASGLGPALPDEMRPAAFDI